jgi:hypothetical protein
MRSCSSSLAASEIQKGRTANFNSPAVSFPDKRSAFPHCHNPYQAGSSRSPPRWANTSTSHGRLMLTVLGGLAEFERDLIRTRTGEGRARAVARGVRLGRKPKLTNHQIKEALRRREAGEVLTEIARSYNVSHSTISRLRNQPGSPHLPPFETASCPSCIQKPSPCWRSPARWAT